jgi:PAS domain S-box-containing protein
MESTPDAVFVKDLQSRYVMINPAAAQFVGRAPDEVLGFTDARIFPGETGQWVMERDRQVIEKGIALHTNYHSRVLGGFVPTL